MILISKRKKNNKTLVVLAECRFYKDSDGLYYSADNYGTRFWERYLDVFDNVIVAARTGQFCKRADFVRVDSDEVIVYPLKYYRGPFVFIFAFPFLIIQLYKLNQIASYFILRAPSILGFIFYIINKVVGKKYFIELVGDATETFSDQASKNQFRKFYRGLFNFSTRAMVKNAAGVSYVTKSVLQSKFPPGNGAFTTYYSSVIIKEREFKKRLLHNIPNNCSQLNLVTVGSMSIPYKRIDTCILALNQVLKFGINARLVVLGDGVLRDDFQKLVNDLGIDNHVFFAGQINDRNLYFQYLDEANIFLTASSTEGLPRAVIEAMARSLPIVATDVGGTSELVSEEFLFQPGDYLKMADLIILLNSNYELYKAVSASNYTKSLLFEEDVLRNRRSQFYGQIINIYERGF